MKTRQDEYKEALHIEYFEEWKCPQLPKQFLKLSGILW